MSRHATSASAPCSWYSTSWSTSAPAAHFQHDTLATLTRATGATRAAWTPSGPSQSLYKPANAKATRSYTVPWLCLTWWAGHLFHSRGVGFRGWSYCHDQIRTPKQRVVKTTQIILFPIRAPATYNTLASSKSNNCFSMRSRGCVDLGNTDA